MTPRVAKKFQILVCRGPDCGDRLHSADVYDALDRELKVCNLGGNEATLGLYSCFGQCKKGVNVLVREVRPNENARMILFMPTAGPGAFLYRAVRPEEARRIVEEHVAAGRPLVEWTRRVPAAQ
jgi:(2Fe-2S) ferredoxin